MLLLIAYLARVLPKGETDRKPKYAIKPLYPNYLYPTADLQTAMYLFVGYVVEEVTLSTENHPVC